MKLSEFIPQEISYLKNGHGVILAEETERRLKDLLRSEGDAELDDELVAIMLNRHKKISDYKEISQKAYWTIWDACTDFYKEGLK